MIVSWRPFSEFEILESRVIINKELSIDIEDAIIETGVPHTIVATEYFQIAMKT